LTGIEDSMAPQGSPQGDPALHSCLSPEPLPPHLQHELLPQGFDSAKATNSSSLIAANLGRKARLKVGTRTRASWHLVDEAHQRAHLLLAPPELPA